MNFGKNRGAKQSVEVEMRPVTTHGLTGMNFKRKSKGRENKDYNYYYNTDCYAFGWRCTNFSRCAAARQCTPLFSLRARLLKERTSPDSRPAYMIPGESVS